MMMVQIWVDITKRQNLRKNNFRMGGKKRLKLGESRPIGVTTGGV